MTGPKLKGNSIIDMLDGSVCLVLTGGKTMRIDKNKLPLLGGRRVGYDGKYAHLSFYGNSVRVHSLLCPCKQGEEVDHINHDRLDNRKSNIRICSHSENMHNQVLRRDNSSGFSGVSKKRNKWYAYAQIDGKRIIKGFDSIEGAIEFRQAIAKKMHGEFYREE